MLPAEDAPAPDADEKSPADAPDPDSAEFPRYVMSRIDDMYRGTSSHAVMSMKVKTQQWERTLTLESWSRGKEKSLVRILEPKKERGTATLKSGDELFTYLNKTGRTIKIGGAMMGSRWMGSHFTNDDLVRETRLDRDYDIVKSFTGKDAGVQIHGFTLTPKPDAPVVWGKIAIAVRASDLQPLREVYFDEDGEKVRVLEFLDHREMDGRMMPTRMVMRPLDGSGEYTEIRWDTVEFDVDLPAGFFSLQHLKRM
jgi:outer membrane lipoprotein-sorting protein